MDKLQSIDSLARTIWDYMLMHQPLRKMDAIFILGSNDTRVAEHAADLYHQGLGEYVICSGGYGKNAKFSQTEATVFGDILLRKGVPEEKIIREHKATNTGENVQYVRRLLQELNLIFTSFLLVQKPYMERRTYVTFRKQWPEVECIVSSPPIPFDEYALDEKHKEGFINTMVGDLERILEYPALGFQIPQEVPQEVVDAMQKLHSMGYTKYKLHI